MYLVDHIVFCKLLRYPLPSLVPSMVHIQYPLPHLMHSPLHHTLHSILLFNGRRMGFCTRQFNRRFTSQFTGQINGSLLRPMNCLLIPPLHSHVRWHMVPQRALQWVHHCNDALCNSTGGSTVGSMGIDWPRELTVDAPCAHTPRMALCESITLCGA